MVASSIPGRRGYYRDGSANHLSISPCHQGQLSRLPSAGLENEYQPKCGDALRLRSKGRYGSFHLWINVHVAGFHFGGINLTKF